MSATRLLACLLLLAGFCLPASAEPANPPEGGNPVTPPPRVKLSFTRFYDYDETIAVLETLREAHPGWLELTSIGKSYQGRELVLAILSDPAAAPHEERPAMYIDANVHGNEIQGTETCLYTIWYLLENRDRLAPIGELLERVSFYILPIVNPDARQSWFDDPNTPHSPRSGLAPFDTDRDGQADEDGPEDLDGDGSITQMRRRVERGGTHVEDPKDPRILLPAPPGEEGQFLLLGWEGIDNDGDGEVNEDGPGGYDMNRNWPADWQPDWIQPGAGPYPLCWPETRAIADFLLARPNVAAIQSYHNAGGMILRGPGHRDRGEYPRQDVAVYDRLGRTGEEILPHYRYMILFKDLYSVRGGFVTWGYEGLGVFSFTNELWSSDQYSAGVTAAATSPSGNGPTGWADRQRERLRFGDLLEHGSQFTDWAPFDHPDLGRIEIGGLKKTSSRVPPLFMLPELVHRNTAFTLHHASEMPQLVLSPPEIERVGEGLYRVRAEIRNLRLTPTITAYAQQHGIGRPDFFEIEVREGVVAAGGIVTGPEHRERIRPSEYRPARLRVEEGVGSHGRTRAEWLVVSKETPRIVVVYRSEKGGTHRAP